MKKNNEIITNDIDKFPEFENIRNAIIEAREKVATTVNFAMVSAYWTIGKQLHEAMSGDGSIYGKQLIKYVSVRLSEEFGQGFDERNLRNMRQFYEVYPKWNTVWSELSWSHYRLLMRIKEQEKREYYQNECVECGWSVRQLERQINSFYYERILATSEGKKAEGWATGLKYDANDIYLATIYSETRNMAPISGGFANKAQNFEVVAQYQFDFGLRPSLGYVQSKGKDIEGIGDEDIVKYIDVGATYYFNKNMSAFVDYKINQIDDDNKLGVSSDDIVALGMTYQF